MTDHPEVTLVARAARLDDVPDGATVIMVPRIEEVDWLNLHRPLFADRALRLVLFCDGRTSAGLALRAPDLFDWISHRVECPPAAPSHAVAGLRAAVQLSIPAVRWDGLEPELSQVLADAVGGRLHPFIPTSYDELVEELRRTCSGPEWTCITPTSHLEVGRIRLALAEARRSRPVLLISFPLEAPGWWDAPSLRRSRLPDFPGCWGIHGRFAELDQAIDRLTSRGAPARLAALLGLEPEAISMAAGVLGAGMIPSVLEQITIEAADPGAEVARLAERKSPVDLDDIMRGAVSPPYLRMRPHKVAGISFWRQRWAAREPDCWTALEQDIQARPRSFISLVERALVLGDTEIAARWARRERSADPDSPQVLHLSARVAYQRGRYAEAAAILSAVCASALQTTAGVSLSPGDLSRLADMMATLAWSYARLSDVEEAEPALPLSRSILRHARRASDELVAALEGAGRSPEAAMMLTSRAMQLRQVGLATLAEQDFRRALSLREQVHGLAHPDVAASISNLAAAHLEPPQRPLFGLPVLDMFRWAQRLLESLLGPDHPAVATVAHNRAVCHLHQGQEEQAIEAFSQAYAIHSGIWGAAHPKTAVSREHLAQALVRAGRHREAAGLGLPPRSGAHAAIPGLKFLSGSLLDLPPLTRGTTPAAAPRRRSRH